MIEHRALRVLVIDDSAFSRQAITRMLETSALIEVVGVARDGEEALRKTFDLEPDLVTLDLEMPRMDGFTYLRLVMARRPTPVLVVSGRSDDQNVFKALDLGAVDFIAKPTPHAAPELVDIEEELIRKVLVSTELRLENLGDRLTAQPSVAAPARRGRREPSVVVIASSTGGPAALVQLFGAFEAPPPCVFLVAQHMPPGFTATFAERLARLTPFDAREARGGEGLEPGSVLVAPGGCHLELAASGGRVETRVLPADGSDRFVPSADRLFRSAAKHHGEDLLGVVLTGMGDDGRIGVQEVKQAGGRVIAESESTAVVFGMPQQAIATGVVDEVLPLSEMASAIHGGGASSADAQSGTRGST